MNEGKPNWMIYGANGYTGRLIAQAAHARGMKPVLAGRNRDEIDSLSKSLGLSGQAFSLDDDAVIREQIRGMKLVLHCAGPFSKTASPMVKACMAEGAHYLDITGEIAVFEKILSRNKEIAAAGIVAIPGIGFDVVPSDCLSALLKESLPDATELELVLLPKGGFSPGTLKTMLEGFYVGTVVREQGKIRLLNGFSVESRLIRGKPVQLMGIAWGDVSSAYYSTGIPNIRVFLRTNTKSIRWLSLAQKLRALWKLPILQSLMKAVVEKRVAGPSIEERESSHYEIWGTVRNMRKEERTLGIRTQNGYSFTVDSALLGVEKILSAPPKPGAMTPSMAFGAKFATEIVSAELMR